MAENDLTFDRDQVLAHIKRALNQDVTITEKQLDAFIHDLKALIRKDQLRLFGNKKTKCNCPCHLLKALREEAKQLGNAAENVAPANSDDKSVPAKPAYSFIRPWSANQPGNRPKNLKQDPVRLHQQYRESWRRHPFPGEADHKELRWNIREKMLGQGPQPKEENCPCPCHNPEICTEKDCENCLNPVSRISSHRI